MLPCSCPRFYLTFDFAFVFAFKLLCNESASSVEIHWARVFGKRNRNRGSEAKKAINHRRRRRRQVLILIFMDTVLTVSYLSFDETVEKPYAAPYVLLVLREYIEEYIKTLKSLEILLS